MNGPAHARPAPGSRHQARRDATRRHHGHSHVPFRPCSINKLRDMETMPPFCLTRPGTSMGRNSQGAYAIPEVQLRRKLASV